MSHGPAKIFEHMRQTLIRLRKQRGWSQKELEQLIEPILERKPSDLSAYETGRSRIPLDVLYALIRIFDVPWSTFLPPDSRQINEANAILQDPDLVQAIVFLKEEVGEEETRRWLKNTVMENLKFNDQAYRKARIYDQLQSKGRHFLTHNRKLLGPKRPLPET